MRVHSCSRPDALGGLEIWLEEGCASSPKFFQLALTILLLQCDIGSICLVLGAWVRYAGNTNSLPSGSAYALLVLGQVRSTVLSPPWAALAYVQRPL